MNFAWEAPWLASSGSGMYRVRSCQPDSQISGVLFREGGLPMHAVEEHADEAAYDRSISLKLSRRRYQNACMSQLHLRDLKANHPGGWRDISPVQAAKIAKPPEGPMPQKCAASSVDGWLLEHGTSALPFSLKTAMAARFSPSALNSRR
jgi:hypothetical protein